MTNEELENPDIDPPLPDLNPLYEMVCCCRPELPHNDENKFIIVKRYPSIEKKRPLINSPDNPEGEDTFDHSLLTPEELN